MTLGQKIVHMIQILDKSKVKSLSQAIVAIKVDPELGDEFMNVKLRDVLQLRIGEVLEIAEAAREK